MCRTGVVSTSGSDSGEVDDANTKWVYFEVADTGVGIGPKGLKSLFKEFVQVCNLLISSFCMVAASQGMIGRRRLSSETCLSNSVWSFQHEACPLRAC